MRASGVTRRAGLSRSKSRATAMMLVSRRGRVLSLYCMHTETEPTMGELMRFVADRFDSVDAQLGEAREKLRIIDSTLADVREDQSAVTAAVDADAVTLIELDRRVTSLETA